MAKAAHPDSMQLHDTASDFERHAGDPNFVFSLARGLCVIESFQGHTEGRSLGESAQVTGSSRAAVRRLPLTLEMLGYVGAHALRMDQKQVLRRRLPVLQKSAAALSDLLL